MSTMTVPGMQWAGRAARTSARAGWPVVASAIFLAVLVVIALLAPLLAPKDPIATNLGSIYAGMSWTNLLGTDELGRDVASRLMWAARVSLIGPFVVVVVAATAGAAIAVTTAWIGGRFDSVCTSILDTILGFPGILLAILSVALFGRGLVAPVVALTIAYTPYFARITRSVALRERSQPYVAALTVQGLGGVRVSTRHILPNIVPVIFAQAAILFGYAMVDLAAISFLGLGVQPPTSDWGSMVAVGQAGVLLGHPLTSLSAGTAIVLTVISVNILGEGIASRSAKGRA